MRRALSIICLIVLAACALVLGVFGNTLRLALETLLYVGKPFVHGFFTALGITTGVMFGLLWWNVLFAHAATIPQDAQRHRATLIREARYRFGLDAPVATFAAQIHQESEWRAGAVSPVGAQGLAQFMPGTSRWLPTVMPDTDQPAPFNPAWAIRALVAYDWWILQRVRAATPCDHMAKGLAGYNGGPGWLTRDERKAAAQGLDPDAWWGHVESVNAGRSRAAWRENRDYPRRILLVLEPVYMAAGWGAGSCPAEGGRS